VFSGGFSAEAAEAIAGASLEMLATLVDKSLLRSGADGRFQLHELPRQFAAEQLAADEPLVHTTHARHSAYYLAFLAEREGRLLGPHQRAAADEISHEAENVRAAWRRAIEHGDVKLIDHALASCFNYYVTRDYYQEGDELFSLAVFVTPSESTAAAALTCSHIHARARIRRGALRFFLGDYVLAGQDLESGLAAAHELGLHGDIVYANMMLGALARWRGDTTDARQRLGDALEIGRAIGDELIVAQTLQNLAWMAGSSGNYAQCARLAQESLAITRASMRDDLTAHALDALGWSAVCGGEYETGEAYYRESLQLVERIGNELGIAGASGGVGWVAWCIGGSRLQLAREHIERSLAIVRKLGRRLDITNYLGDLGLIMIDSGEYAQAYACAQEGLALARALDSAIYTTYHLGILGHVAAVRQEFTASRRYLREALRTASEARLWAQLALALYHTAVALMREAAFVGMSDPTNAARQACTLELMAAIVDHPAVWHVCQARARRLIDELRHHLPRDLAGAAIARGQRLDWQTSVEPLLDALVAPVAAHA
jgi:tetratricopeptide (TPR) repeat protein